MSAALPLTRPQLSEHAALHLREGILGGRWPGRLPGVRKLAEELGISRDVVRDALRHLEAAGVLAHHGAGRSRAVVQGCKALAQRRLRVGIFLPGPLESENALTFQLIYNIRQAIEAMGHGCFIAPRTCASLQQSPVRAKTFLQDCEADAWIFYSMHRRQLEMAADLSKPVFALGGTSEGLPLAGSLADLSAPIREAVTLLADKGHRRMVLISPPRWRKPVPNASVCAFLDALKQRHIQGDMGYNVPEWRHTPEGLQGLMQALFKATPPTALLVMEPEWIGPVLVFLAERGLQVPRDISLINLLPDPMQSFYCRKIAHFRWPLASHVRHVCQWLKGVAAGEVRPVRRSVSPSFDPGETVGRARTLSL